MPIKPENAARYPVDWKEISERIRFERAGGRCEQCGVRHGAVGYRKTDGTFVELSEAELHNHVPEDGRIIKIVLTTAHLDHNPENCADDNLLALCQLHHLRLDIDHHRANRAETRRAKLKMSGVQELFR